MAINVQTYYKTSWDQAFADAIAGCEANGLTLLIPDGRYALTAGVALACNVISEPGAEIRYSGAGPAVTVGTPDSVISNRTITLPSIRGAAIDGKPAWVTNGIVDDDAGLLVRNVQHSTIRFGQILNFSAGLKVVGQGAANGSTENAIEGNVLTNNAIAFWIAPGLDGGWTTQHTVRINRYHIGGSLTVDPFVPGTCYIRIDEPRKGFMFQGGNLAGSSEEYALWTAAAQAMFVGMRWESGPTRQHHIHFADGAQRNEIVGGPDLDTVVVTKGTNTEANILYWPEAPGLVQMVA